MSEKKKKHFEVVITADECKGCGRCVKACPKSVLEMGKKLNCFGFPAAIVVNDDCIGCGSCFYACPEPGAVSVYETEDAVE